MFHASFLPNDSGCQKVAKSRKAERLQAHPAKEGEVLREGAGSVGWASVSTDPEAAFVLSWPVIQDGGPRRGTGHVYPYKAQQVMPGLQGEGEDGGHEVGGKGWLGTPALLSPATLLNLSLLS